MKFLTKKARQGELPSDTITYLWSIREETSFVNTEKATTLLLLALVKTVKNDENYGSIKPQNDPILH